MLCYKWSFYQKLEFDIQIHAVCYSSYVSISVNIALSKNAGAVLILEALLLAVSSDELLIRLSSRILPFFGEIRSFKGIESEKMDTLQTGSRGKNLTIQNDFGKTAYYLDEGPRITSLADLRFVKRLTGSTLCC